MPSGTKLITQWEEREDKYEKLFRISYGSGSGNSRHEKHKVRKNVSSENTGWQSGGKQQRSLVMISNC